MTFLEKCIGVLAILIFLMITGVAKAGEKTLTAQEFASNVAEVPSKVGNWLTGEVEKTKAYQTKVWSEAKNKWPWNLFKSKNNVSQD